MRFPTLTALASALGFSVIFAAACQAGPFEDAQAAASQGGDINVPIRRLLPAAEGGDAPAQAGVGYLYLYVSEYPQALEWFRKAAEQGNANAARYLGDMYDGGWGVPKDHDAAIAWYRRAAAAGDETAKDRLQSFEAFDAAQNLTLTCPTLSAADLQNPMVAYEFSLEKGRLQQFPTFSKGLGPYNTAPYTTVYDHMDVGRVYFRVGVEYATGFRPGGVVGQPDLSNAIRWYQKTIDFYTSLPKQCEASTPIPVGISSAQQQMAQAMTERDKENTALANQAAQQQQEQASDLAEQHRIAMLEMKPKDVGDQVCFYEEMPQLFKSGMYRITKSGYVERIYKQKLQVRVHNGGDAVDTLLWLDQGVTWKCGDD
jgi:tetratricopeptide (TPR) repeat protein